MPTPTDSQDLSTTHDTILSGTLRFEQPKHGFRAGSDSVILARLAGKSSRLAVDIGAGAGMVSLMMLAVDPTLKLLCIENDPLAVQCLSRNIASNSFSERATVLAQDVLKAATAHRGCADLVVANPPYWLAGSVSESQNQSAQKARAGDGSLEHFLKATRLLLGRSGRAVFIFPAPELERFLLASTRLGLAAKQLRFVHPFPDRPANRVVVVLRAAKPGGLEVLPPLIMQTSLENYSDEFARMSLPP